MTLSSAEMGRSVVASAKVRTGMPSVALNKAEFARRVRKRTHEHHGVAIRRLPRREVDANGASRTAMILDHNGLTKAQAKLGTKIAAVRGAFSIIAKMLSGGLRSPES